MKEVAAVLIEKIKRTQTVLSLRFKPEERIDFLPGQFLQLIFDQENKSNQSLNKYLSFSCAPSKDYIEVTKRLSDSQFSQRLVELKEGDLVLVKGPMGSCVFKEDYSKIAFLIGGIGITPVISILEHIVDKQLPSDVVLLYSNRSEEETAFKSELDALSKRNQEIKVNYIVTSCEPKNKDCLFGKIDRDNVLVHVVDYKRRIFFIFGPPVMVAAMQRICVEIGCIKEMVKTENFIGY
ncbi:MAG: FAD-dependent oxidoreductase [Candidatus Omnitrophota bacterium]